MRLPSTRTIGIAGVGLSLGVPAAAALGAPQGVWIGMAIAALLCLAAALAHYLLVDCKQPAEAPMDRPRAIKRGKDLLRGIEAEQITFRAQPWNTMLGTLLRNRTAEVERWATATGSTKAVPPAPHGKPAEMDYAQLVAYVREALAGQ
jgi:hypothetical protein